jgi:type II secretory pathway pseudopilin PulG
VVIGIIAILAGIALGPITRGIKQAKQSAGMQTARTIGLAEFAFSNDNNNSYPDTGIPTGNTGTDATTIAKPLLAGSYVTDPTVFFISGGTAKKFTGTTPAQNIAVSNISFDFVGTGSGIGTNYPDALPVCMSTIVGGTQPTLTAAAGTAITCAPIATNPFGIDGVAVAYKSNSSKFITANNLTGTPVCTLVDTSNPGGAPATAKIYPGGG